MIFLISLPLALYSLLISSSGQIIWAWSSGIENYVIPAFKTVQWPMLVGYPTLGLVVYLALTYGFRLLGLGELMKALRPSQNRPVHLMLAIFVVLGPLLSLTSKIIPRDDPNGYNNAIWFMVTSKYVVVLFSMAALLKLWDSIAPAWRPALIALVAAGSLPSTLQYVIKPPAVKLGKLNSSTMKTIAFLNHEAQAGDVAFSRLDHPLLVLTKLRLPFFKIYQASFAKPEAIDMRIRDMEDFWKSWGHEEVREDLLLKYHANWIVTTQSDGILSERPVIELDKLRLQRMFTNGGYIVFQVLPRPNQTELR